jgi:hypothetical protein
MPRAGKRPERESEPGDKPEWNASALRTGPPPAFGSSRQEPMAASQAARVIA